ncbi:hypothetical protein KC799_27265, partial [candidate division KSB1 bacterium]|nr:hypothetical protein [candidate division KSB1 bacterium]
VPEDLRSFVEKTKAQRGHAITTHSIKWGDERLKKFLKNRLEWASKGEISSLNDMTADDQALALIDLDKVFIETILTSEVLKKERGIPRTLLLLGKGLFRIAEKKNEPLITKVVWDTFVNEATHRNWVFRIWQGLVIFYRKLREVTPKSGFEV